MCYPKPGPRCASHTRKAVKRAWDDFKEQVQIHNEVRDALHADPEDVAHYAERVDRARAVYDEARNEYEATPEGQSMLQEAIDKYADEDLNTANLLRTRLQNAVDLRARQVEDYALSLEYAQRLDAMTPQAKQAIVSAEEELDRAVFSSISAEALLDDHTLTSDRAVKALKAAEDDVAEAKTALMQAQASYDESVEHHDDEAIGISRAHLAAARSDLEAANSRHQDADIAVGHASRMLAEIQEQAAFERNIVARSRQHRDRVTAGIAAGLGHEFRDLHLAQPHSSDLVYANTDGTLNVARHLPPSDGFPHGRFVRATGVSHGPSHSVILFADGSSVHATTDYAVSPEPSEPGDLVIFEPDVDATPALGAGQSFHARLNRAG